MTQLIADSGSTKTDWRLLNDNNEPVAFQTEGLNPYHLSDLVILDILKNDVIPHVKTIPNEIHFYGAGCAAKENKQIMINCFQHFFPDGRIEIETDLLGASRALLFNEKGVVAILGTGSNAGIYNGAQITKSFDSLGRILGDEGSGFYIGKLILRDWLRGKFVAELSNAIAEFCLLSRDEILNRIYHDQNSATFISGFAKFAQQEIASQQIKQILHEAFHDFINEVAFVFKLPAGTRINFCGSIAWSFQKQLAEELRGYDLEMGRVIQSPIEELVKFHSTHS